MEPQLYPALLNDIEAAFEKIRDLPYPIYACNAEGIFLFANEQAYQRFGFDRNVPLESCNIRSYYQNPAERAALLAELRHHPLGVWVQDLNVTLRFDGHPCKIRFASRPFFDDHGELRALLCMAFEVNGMERYAEFEKSIEAGFFELDSRLMLRDYNPAFAKILHFTGPDNALRGKSLGELLWEPGETEKFLREIQEKESIEDRLVKLRRQNGVPAFTKMSCIACPDATGGIAYIKGTVRDITADIIEDNLPVGLFMVSKDPDMRPVIAHANRTFAHIHGFDSPDEMMGKVVAKFQNNPGTYQVYKDALDEAAAEGQPLLEHFMKIRSHGGKELEVVVNAQYVEGEDRLVRVGSMTDITGHERSHIQTIADNFSALLHTYLATVNGLRDTLIMLTRAHGQDLLKKDRFIDRSQAITEANRHRKRLEEYIAELAKTIEERKLDRTQLLRLQRYRDIMNNPKEEFAEKEKDNAAWLRRNLVEINKQIRDLRNLNLPRELIRGLRSEVEDMLRLTSMVSISLSIDELNERIPEFYYFRDYLRRGKSADKEKMAAQNIIPVLVSQTQKLEEFASARRVTIVQHFNPYENIPVACRADLNRAFHSLLHNAIKYSWTKSKDRQAHVDIYVEKKKDEVEIIIENWGVPIRKEELEGGEILQFGKRGREADDRGRSGTGIGLYDANDIITQHNGKLRLTSEPTFGNPPEVYSNPFITRAFITLPIAKKL